jgi:hypothetical protein
VGDANYVDVRGGAVSFEKLFNEYSSKRDFFLVTDFDELDRQPELRESLFTAYPVLAQENDFLIFDLQNHIQ